MSISTFEPTELDSLHLLTIEETAQVFRCSKATVRRFLESNRLRGVRLGKVWRVDAACVREVLGGRVA
jgi:excisionase family DNA binding protein